MKLKIREGVCDGHLSWMNACDPFVLLSVAEGNPTVMFKCLGCEKSFPEIITSDDYGLLCEPANPEDLAKKILIALDKEWDYEEIRSYAEKFKVENKTNEILKVYAGLENVKYE